jgi:hypothetical protein
MPDLRWPDGRGHFRDQDAARVQGVVDVDDAPLNVAPGDVINVSDPETVDHYLSRGFERVEPSDQDSEDDADASADDDTDSGGQDDTADDGGEDDFVGAFLDRTPVGDVADDIAAGDADGHLDVVEAEASRTTVTDAVKDRRQELDDGGD